MLDEYYNAETQTLTLPYDFNEELSNLPIDVLIIIFEEDLNKSQNSRFNQSVDATRKNFIFTDAPKNDSVFDGDKLPVNLTHINFGYEFNQSVNSLPENLTNLTFGFKFNQSVDSLPSKLINLTFGDNFNRSVNLLPNTITRLTFGFWFNQSVNSLPAKLKKLTFAHCFNQSVDNLPNTIKVLSYYGKSKLNNIPNNVEYINIYFYGDEDYYDDGPYNETIENIPLNVKEIRINRRDKAHCLRKIPFGCKVVDKLGKEIFL
jgi:hypothetical protein